MQREVMLGRLAGEPFDIVIIGGGATGLGIAVDASSRGYRTLLLEAHDFAKGTSSRSTKLVHGGVRHLEQLNFSLVTEALRERGLLYENAPHLVRNLGFVVPRFHWWEGPFYGVGLKLYDTLAGKLNLAASRNLDRDETIEAIPNVERKGLLGGIMYHDAQFDDARMAVTLALTAADHGAVVLNRMQVVELIKTESGAGQTCGVVAQDVETGERHRILARVVVNATGVFSDAVRKLDQPDAQDMTLLSQGIHLVLDASFQPAPSAIMVPHTDDGRVLFVIPWYGRVLVGTTDTPIAHASLEPRALPEEVDFVLRNAGRYMAKDPTREDVLSVFAGLRPLVRAEPGAQTKAVSREHVVFVSNSGLVTILGGKWTTYRKMAEDTLSDAIQVGGLVARRCVTESLRLHGFMRRDDAALPKDAILRTYGSDAGALEDLAHREESLRALLHPALPYRAVHVIWAVRHEMARSVEDVLARRTRSLLLDAHAAIEAAPGVAELMARELGRDATWVRTEVAAFRDLARGYLLAPRGAAC
ncbi:MAG: glycerol-3-phosphate dehydrogenase/oxidase [Myxococcales bacterium]|nr:glycerol-3-phosphate dehydrogenase/oxidase [Myxococcales bacterium]